MINLYLTKICKDRNALDCEFREWHNKGFNPQMVNNKVYVEQHCVAQLDVNVNLQRMELRPPLSKLKEFDSQWADVAEKWFNGAAERAVQKHDLMRFNMEENSFIDVYKVVKPLIKMETVPDWESKPDHKIFREEFACFNAIFEDIPFLVWEFIRKKFDKLTIPDMGTPIMATVYVPGTLVSVEQIVFFKGEYGIVE